MDKIIETYMKKLGLTYEEAVQLYEDENADNLPDLTDEQKQVEKEMLRAERKKETAPRKRERKADDSKRHLIRLLEIAIGYNPEVTDFIITNVEREMEFTFRGEKYRLTLAKPRK